MYKKLLLLFFLVFLASAVFAQNGGENADLILIFTIISLLLFVVSIILFLWAAFDIMKGKKSGSWKALWVVVCFFIPIAGVIIYYVVGKKAVEEEAEKGEVAKKKREIEGIKIPIIEKYKRILKQAKFKVTADVWIIVSVTLSVVIALLLLAVILLLGSPVSPLLALIAFLVCADLTLGYPYLLGIRRIAKIEEALPDALKQMADTLKAGGTYEYALREISTAQYGPLTEEMANVLRKLEEGENLENSLNSFANSVDSKLVKRSIAIIIDSIKAGAGLADILDEIADDIRAMHRIMRQRRAETSLQVLFMIFAGAIVAPIILGLVSSVIGLFIRATAGLGASGVEQAAAFAFRDFMMLLTQAYLMIEVIAASIMIALMREGKINKSIIYIPILLLLAFIAYYVAAWITSGFIGAAV